MNARTFERLSLENNLRKALQDSQFEMYFQPKVSIATGRVVAAEALVKWNHTDLGLISPLEFISIAKETGLIVPLGEWILRESCARERLRHTLFESGPRESSRRDPRKNRAAPSTTGARDHRESAHARYRQSYSVAFGIQKNGCWDLDR